MIKISVANQKGGVGKTTIVFHLAHVWAGQGKKVLCVDMDPQGNLSSSFCPEGIPEKSLVSAVFRKKKPEVMRTESGIYLAASDISLSVHEKEPEGKAEALLRGAAHGVHNGAGRGRELVRRKLAYGCG